MNELLGDVALITIGIAMIYWEIQTKKKITKKECTTMDTARTFSSFALGIVLILGGLLRIILL